MTLSAPAARLSRTVPASPLRKPFLYQQKRAVSVRRRLPTANSGAPSPATNQSPNGDFKAPPKFAPPRPAGPEKDTVMFPRTRIAIGIVFLGALLYSFETPLPEVSKPKLKVAHTEAPPPRVADLDEKSKKESGITATSPMRLRMEAFIKEQQNEIVAALEALDGGKFRRDTWTRSHGGGGISCVLQDGNVFEKAGVNVSVVYGTLPKAAIEKMRVNHRSLDDPSIESLEFFAAGLSIVLHPHNPQAPTVHMNCRYFETMDKSGDGKAWWFGGGTDLTPTYLFDEDAIHFHKTLKDSCDRHNKNYYGRFKDWCDKYFYIPHRGESRGIGGIFFDDLDEDENSQEEIFAFVKDVSSAFLPSYMPIVTRRKDLPYTENDKLWQLLRRGRYVEFNLLYDRGTSFGLNAPGARVESILMSLPRNARWEYMHEPEVGSKEMKILSVLKKPETWIHLEGEEKGV